MRAILATLAVKNVCRVSLFGLSCFLFLITSMKEVMFPRLWVCMFIMSAQLRSHFILEAIWIRIWSQQFLKGFFNTGTQGTF